MIRKDNGFIVLVVFSCACLQKNLICLFVCLEL